MQANKKIKPFDYPLGLQAAERTNFRQREGYEAAFLKDDETPRYRYSVILSANRIAKAIDLAFELLPPRLHVIIEESKFAEGEPPHVEVWSGQEMEKGVIRRVWEDHKELFVHDGMLGFGAANFDRAVEVFLDCHKILYIYSVDMEIPERIVRPLGLKFYKRLPHISDIGYDAVSLRELGQGEDYHEVLEELRTELGLDLAEVR
jgi:hypothetical protein